MAVKELAEATATSETWISVWYDEAEHEVYLQYGYAGLSMPVEDFRDLVETLVEAGQRLESQ
jgi:hypothetical protein